MVLRKPSRHTKEMLLGESERAQLHLTISHQKRRSLNARLQRAFVGEQGVLIPGYDGGTDDDRPRVTVWPSDEVSAGHPTGGRVVLPVRAFGDESINGAWTLVVTDENADGQGGGVFGWTLGYSSRYD